MPVQQCNSNSGAGRGPKPDPLSDPLSPADLIALDTPDTASIWDSLTPAASTDQAASDTPAPPPPTAAGGRHARHRA
ncbi:hypothetical protein, partial [Gordonia desulfuricans]|uniref:hypothetical protein n=1 Tax=Gordonia desulfuricans TaxID=89051 RepID=UPI001EE4AA7D